MVRPLIAAAVLLLAACGQEGETWTAQAAQGAADSTAEAGYLAPPAVTSARLEGEAVRVEGTAAPNARVRIAPPRGEPILVPAGADGHWGALLTPSQPVHLFGLSMTEDGKSAQAEGYVMMARDGAVAQLRAGAGAVVLAGPSDRPTILALDYDREGGAVVSGVARPGATLGLRVDRAARGETRADAKGRFSISLTEPLAMGAHQVEVFGDGGADTRRVAISPAGDIGAGPYLGERTAFGWRIDWMTPGGGVQTSYIFQGPAA
ncbi:MAG TPA: hypothetical protein VF138_13205 [Caulobacteraceae bacterium]